MSPRWAETTRSADAGRVGLPDAFAEFYGRPYADARDLQRQCPELRIELS
ncbi:MAG TPA: hypothetical protein VIG35_00995 [Gaiellaceae bacterium]|jgi:hypothetical protein